MNIRAKMNIRDCLRGGAAICFVVLGLGACTDNGSSAQKAAAVDTWTAVPADAASKVTQIRRTVALQGGGELALRLSCDFRPNADPVMNGFWLKLEGTFKGANGAALAIDAKAITDGLAYFVVVRSTGEASQMLAEAKDASHFTYENNQTNELNNDNNDPAKVEIAKSIDIPLNDGRIISVLMQKDEAGYTGLLSRCATLGPK